MSPPAPRDAVRGVRTRARRPRWRLAGLLGLLAGACAAPRAETARFELFVLGTAQDGGMPHFGCERACCVEARRDGRVLHPACLGIVDHDKAALVLVEATPHIEQQVAELHRLAGIAGRGRQPIDAVLVTHAHIGHYLGLAFCGREVASTRQLPVHCSPRFAAFLRGNGPWRQLVELEQIVPREFVPEQPFAPIEGIEVIAIAVPHRDEFSDTMAFRIRGPRRTVLFVPDIDAWDRAPGLLDHLLAGVDIAYVDGTFFDGSELPERNLAEIRHPLMTDTMRRLDGFARQHPGAVRFIHLNHTNPALHDAAIRDRIDAAGFRVARPGECVAL
ncbi:MAG TPA: MBL fold metallo-hydrolase [Planctomycetota bacterium]|nr:MBL fold metallo-hydrolase [Planctomycetota bacterium]